MPLIAVFLDTTPLGLVSQKYGKSSEADACRAWMMNLLAHGVRVYMPEIADYEVRRELIRSGQTAGVIRLNNLKSVLRYMPITTDAMLTAADIWAQVRNAGIATADIHALDGDVIVAAQALSLALSEFVVATQNVKHVSRFVPADLWTNITP